MRSLYPAKSNQSIREICDKICNVYKLPKFEVTLTSEYFETQQSMSNFFGFNLTEYFGKINAEKAKTISAPYYWNLAWRAAVGLEYNYMVEFIRNENVFSRQQARKIKHSLRDIFSEIKLHGDNTIA